MAEEVIVTTEGDPTPEPTPNVVITNVVPPSDDGESDTVARLVAEVAQLREYVEDRDDERIRREEEFKERIALLEADVDALILVEAEEELEPEPVVEDVVIPEIPAEPPKRKGWDYFSQKWGQ